MYKKTTHPLTDADIVNAKPSDRNFKLYDEQELYLLIKTTGGKLWRLKYEYEGVERSVTFGTYPELSLNDARVMCEQHHHDIEHGIDPSIHRKSSKSAKSSKLL